MALRWYPLLWRLRPARPRAAVARAQAPAAASPCTCEAPRPRLGPAAAWRPDPQLPAATLRAWIEAAESDERTERKRTDRKSLRAVTLQGRAAWLKRYEAPRGFAALRHLFRQPRAARAFQAARALEARGLPTPPPLGFLALRGFAGRHGPSWFVYEAIPGTLDLRRRAERDGDRWTPLARARLARALARLYLRLLDAGLVHADFKAENILVFEEDPLPRRFLLIDLDGLRFDPAPSRYAVARNVVQLHDALGGCSGPLDRAVFLRRLTPVFPWLGEPAVLRRLDRWTRRRNPRVPPCAPSSS